MATRRLLTATGGIAQEVPLVGEVAVFVGIIIAAKFDPQSVTWKPVIGRYIVRWPVFPRTRIPTMSHESDIVFAVLLANTAAGRFHIAVNSALFPAAVAGGVIIRDNEVVRGIDLCPRVVPWDICDSNGIVRQDLEISWLGIDGVKLVLENLLVGP